MTLRRPAFWIVFAVVSAAAAFVGVRYFPAAFPIVSLDITMDREGALAAAQAIMTRDRLGPAEYRQAASFSSDTEAQTFVELEGGGKEVFTQMLREGLYAAYAWRVRHFKEAEPNETTIRFTPDGRPYGFVERLKEDAPGAALDAAAARQIAEQAAAANWHVELARFTPVEQGQERRPSGRVDHTFTYERPSPTLNEGRYRLRLVVSGDRLTEVTHFIRIPEAFSRRYASMRAANEAIGIGSIVSLALLYVGCGIGVGLFFMLRRRWVLWRHAMAWGVVVGGLQALTSINSLPLLWMSYDTALPRSTFLVQQLAVIAASFVGFSVFFGLSFMAAETLTRRAFPTHPQLWRVWSRGAGNSTTVLGYTIAGYLLVALFFAYEIALYGLATRGLGWWTPAETLVQPDVLATYVPWLSAIANSFQAGFWEESLFRAVPLAGAALIGDRFGKRTLFLVIGFIVQAIVFGAGHAPYPTQPSYARPVELLLPSIGFGLLYVYWGLLPGIVLHFTFDVVWFALPIFLASAPGVWVQKLMVVVTTLVPVWIVLWRRAQAGRWIELAPADRNGAWSPAPALDRAEVPEIQPRAAISRRAKTAWLAAGAAGLVVCAIALLDPGGAGGLEAGRQQAIDAARGALEQRGANLGPGWRILPSPDNGSGGPHEFVAETAGEARRRELVDVYLPAPRWRVRVATFEGDIAERAEEWLVMVSAKGEVRNVRHTLPEERAGASLEEAASRQLAVRAMSERLGLDSSRAREVSARPEKQKARTDWTFTFTDTTVTPLPQGEPRVSIDIAGEEVAAASRFVFVPEEWQRQARAAGTRNTILRILITLVFGGLLVNAAVGGVIQWSRRQYTPRLFLAAGAVLFAVSLARAANNWPIVFSSLLTAAPLGLQILGVVGVGLVGLTITAALVGLAMGAQPHRLAQNSQLPDGDGRRLGVALGFAAAAVGAAGAWLRTPPWSQAPDIAAFGTYVPLLQSALDPLPGLLTRTAVLLATVTAIDRFTAGWTRRRPLGGAALAAIGFLSAGVPAGAHLGGWLAAGALSAAVLPLAYATLVRFDPAILPIALGTMAIVDAVSRGMQRPFPGAMTGALAAALVTTLVAWWCFRAINRARAAGSAESLIST